MMRYQMWCAAFVCVAVVVSASPKGAQAKITKELKEELQPGIEKGLEASDPLIKAYAALAAGQLKDKNLDKIIIPLMENTNVDVRRAAIVALASRKDKKGLAALDLEIVKAGSGAAYVASEMIPRLPVKVQVQILKGWITGKKTSPALRSAALDYCARFGRDEVFDLMAGVVSSKKEPERQEFLERLVANPRKEAAPWAGKLLADKRNAAARKAGLALAMAIGGASVDPIIRSALTDPDATISAIALDYLSAAGDASAGEHLIKTLPGSTDKLTVATRLLALDQKVPLEVGEKLLAEATADDMALAEVLYGVYGASRDKKAIAKLLEMEQSTLITERRMGAAGLSYTKSAQAARVLERAIFDGHREMRLISARGLGLLGFASSVSILDKAMRGAPNDNELKYLIVQSYGLIKASEAAQKLTYLIRDRDPRLKGLAIDGLASIGDKQAIASLRTVVSLEPDPVLKFKAVLIILKADQDSGLAQFDAVLQRPPEDYIDQISALPKEVRAEVFVKLLKFSKEKVRTDALDGLTYLGEAGLPILRKATGSDFPKEVRDAAILELSRHSSDADQTLFKNLSTAGSPDEQMLALRWLIRTSDSSMAGFFRTLMNGSKGAPARHMATIYAFLKASA